jgi:hypothetical protein
MNHPVPNNQQTADNQTAGNKLPVSVLTRTFHLWHLLSLDAPTVATLWTWFIARASGIYLPASGLAAMFLSVWMLYAADRLLDARPLFTDPLHTDNLEARHLFHHRHATRFLTIITIVAVALVPLLHDLLPQALHLYVLLATLLAAWFLLIHASAPDHRLPKELAVGLFFPAALFIPTIARRPDLRLTLLPDALLLGALCALNCLAIYAWEHPPSRIAAHPATQPEAQSEAQPESQPNAQPKTTAHWTTRYASRHLPTLATALTFAALTLAFATRHTTLWPLALAISLSALVLLMLDRNHYHLTPLTLRATADLALITPILLLWAPHP